MKKRVFASLLALASAVCLSGCVGLYEGRPSTCEGNGPSDPNWPYCTGGGPDDRDPVDWPEEF